jgi:hypothetical protein
MTEMSAKIVLHFEGLIQIFSVPLRSALVHFGK